MKIRFHSFSFSILRLKNLSLQFVSSFMRRRALSLTDLVGMYLKLKCWKIAVVEIPFFTLDSEEPSI